MVTRFYQLSVFMGEMLPVRVMTGSFETFRLGAETQVSITTDWRCGAVISELLRACLVSANLIN